MPCVALCGWTLAPGMAPMGRSICSGVRVVVDLAIEMEQSCLPSRTGGRWQGERST